MSSTELPAGWAWARLGDLGDWYGGGTPSKARPEFWSGGSIPWLSPKDMGQETITATQDQITDEALKECPVRLVPADSVTVVTRSGILERTVPVARVPFATTLNQDMKAIRVHAGVTSSWVAWCLRSFEPKILRDCRKAGTTVASLSTDALMDLQIPVAPLAEQHRIVEALEDHLSRLDAASAYLTSADAKAQHLTSVMMGQAVAGNLSRSVRSHALVRNAAIEENSSSMASRRWKWTDPAPLPDYTPPENWNLVSLGALSYESGYGTSTKCAVGAAGQPVLRIPNIRNGSIDLSDIKSAIDPDLDLSRYFLRPGDLLFVRTNGSRNLIGRVGVVEDSLDYAFASYLIRFRLAPGTVEPRWIQLVTHSPIWRRAIEKYAASSAGQYNLSAEVLARLPIPVPPLDVQRETLEKVDAALFTTDRLSVAVSTTGFRANRLRDALLNKAFSGKLAQQDPADEPASVLLERIRAERQTQGAKPKRARRGTVGRQASPGPAPAAQANPIPSNAVQQELPL